MKTEVQEKNVSVLGEQDFCFDFDHSEVTSKIEAKKISDYDKYDELDLKDLRSIETRIQKAIERKTRPKHNYVFSALSSVIPGKSSGSRVRRFTPVHTSGNEGARDVCKWYNTFFSTSEKDQQIFEKMIKRFGLIDWYSNITCCYPCLGEIEATIEIIADVERAILSNEYADTHKSKSISAYWNLDSRRNRAILVIVRSAVPVQKILELNEGFLR